MIKKSISNDKRERLKRGEKLDQILEQLVSHQDSFFWRMTLPLQSFFSTKYPQDLKVQAELDTLTLSDEETAHKLSIAEKRLHFYRTSFWWKISFPMRFFLIFSKRLFWGAVDRLPLSHSIDLLPAHKLERKGNRLVSTGDDPQAHMVSDKHRLPKGWVKVSLTFSNNPQFQPRMYTDSAVENHPLASIDLLPSGAGEIDCIVRLPNKTNILRFDPMDGVGEVTIDDFRIVEMKTIQVLFLAFIRQPRNCCLAALKVPLHGFSQFKIALGEAVLNDQLNDYDHWIKLYDKLTYSDQQAIIRHCEVFEHKPLISVIMPTYNSSLVELQEAIDSIRNQLYENWELCIADDASSNSGVARLLKNAAASDDRIKIIIREENGHISASSNSALTLARGEYVALMDHDDLLSPHALYHVVLAINEQPSIDILYSDEDKLDAKGRRYDPYFKLDWNYELFLGQNFISHLGVYE